jgi:hypothetical protein
MMRLTVARPIPFPGNSEVECNSWELPIFRHSTGVTKASPVFFIPR